MRFPLQHTTRTYPEIEFRNSNPGFESLFENPNRLNVLVASNFTRTSNLTRTLRPKNCLPNSFSNVTPQALCRSGILAKDRTLPEKLSIWKSGSAAGESGSRVAKSDAIWGGMGVGRPGLKLSERRPIWRPGVARRSGTCPARGSLGVNCLASVFQNFRFSEFPKADIRKSKARVRFVPTRDIRPIQYFLLFSGWKWRVAGLYVGFFC